MVVQGAAEIRKLKVILKTTEEDLLFMRKKYGEALNQLNETGMKLVSVNEELCTLYAKANVQENILRNGDVEIKKREEEIRILNLHISELEREIFVTSYLFIYLFSNPVEKWNRKFRNWKKKKQNF